MFCMHVTHVICIYVYLFSKETREIRERDSRISSESAIPVNVTIALQSPPTAPSSCYIPAVSITTFRRLEFGPLVAELSL